MNSPPLPPISPLLSSPPVWNSQAEVRPHQFEYRQEWFGTIMHLHSRTHSLPYLLASKQEEQSSKSSRAHDRAHFKVGQFTPFRHFGISCVCSRVCLHVHNSIKAVQYRRKHMRICVSDACYLLFRKIVRMAFKVRYFYHFVLSVCLCPGQHSR
uniref:Uncharacterized protein n=1 Tax=Palpitomonas bilix TaxID=652834 RepID=A0A7S3GF43_9EUKA